MSKQRRLLMQKKGQGLRQSIIPCTAPELRGFQPRPWGVLEADSALTERLQALYRAVRRRPVHFIAFGRSGSPPAAAVGTKLVSMTDQDQCQGYTPIEYASSGTGWLEFPVSPDHLDGTDFQQFWKAAYVNDRAEGVRVPSGEYTVLPPQDGCFHLDCTLAEEGPTRPFGLDLSGVDLILTSTEHGGIGLVHAADVEVFGPCSIRHSPEAWPFGQAVLTSVSDDKIKWTIQGCDNYPNDHIFLVGKSLNAILWEADTGLMKGPATGDCITNPVEKIGDNQYQFTVPWIREDMAVGDIITARGPDSCSAVTFDRCQRCTLRDVTIYSTSCFGWYDSFGSGNIYRHNAIIPYTQPLGSDGQLPLLSANADGIHATDDREGPKVLDSTFFNLGDDAIAITGHYSAVAAACPGERSLVLVQQRCNLAAGPGDRMQAYGLDVSDLGTAVIASVEDAANPLAPGAKIDAFNCDADGQGYIKVTVEEWPEAWDALALGCAISYPEWCGSGFEAVGNRVHNTRGRGVLSKASRALIADNTFTHLKGAGVVMTPEIVWWEADFVRDVVVRNNLIQSMAPGVWLGACVAAHDGGDQTPATQRLNRRISIVGNTIEGSLKTAMMITSAADVLIEGNAFRGCLPGPGSSKDHSWEVEGKQLLVVHADSVRIAGNSFLVDGKVTKGDAADTAAFVALVDVGGVESTEALLASEA